MESTIQMRETNLPHVHWIDLLGNGVMEECAVIKQDGRGNVYFIKIASLDVVDRRRLVKILRRPKGGEFELWDLLSTVTLGNGMNALTYFHQLVRVRTPNGEIINPSQTSIGYMRQPTVTG